MKIGTFVTLLTVAILGVAAPTFAQGVRKDVIWARKTTPSAITLDGVLSEAAWATAESTTVVFGTDNGTPGSGWKWEGGALPPSDPTNAKIKFLRDGNQLYMAAVVQDKSIGGSEIFNRFDGFLMAIQDHNVTFRPTIPMEHFYSWYWLGDPTPRAVGKQPSFIGAWGNNPPAPGRTPEQIANWDAVTVVNGIVNDDTANDVSYTVEMRFNVAADGYNYGAAAGDVVEFNISIYDCDWFWPLNVNTFSSNRTWWQGPWGNTSQYHEVKIHGRDDVTTTSGAVPVVGPDVRIRNGAGWPAPTMDGLLTDAVWQAAPSFRITYNDDALRATYPGVGPFRSGQFQATVNGGTAAVLDPGDATVKWFFSGNRLYFGFDVRDQVVQYHPSFDRRDGFLVTINEDTTRGPDKNLAGRRLGWCVNAAGGVGTDIEGNYLPTLVDSGGAQIVLALKPGTTVDTLGNDVDQGYTAEMWVDLTKLSYPSGLGDHIGWIGLNLLDGDSFSPFTDSYGTRTWFFREYEGTACGAWVYFDAALPVVGVDGGSPAAPTRTQLLINAPNPFASNTTVRYALAEPSRVTMEVFDLAGRRVASRDLGLQAAGPGHFVFGRAGLGSGLFVYRLRLADPASGAARGTLSGRMMVIR